MKLNFIKQIKLWGFGLWFRRTIRLFNQADLNSVYQKGLEDGIKIRDTKLIESAIETLGKLTARA